MKISYNLYDLFNDARVDGSGDISFKLMDRQEIIQDFILHLLNGKKSFHSYLKSNAALEFKTNNIESSDGSRIFSNVGGQPITYSESITGDGWCCYVLCFGAFKYSRKERERSKFNDFVGSINRLLHSPKDTNEETKEEFKQFIKENFNWEYLNNNAYGTDLTSSQTDAVRLCKGN